MTAKPLRLKKTSQTSTPPETSESSNAPELAVSTLVVNDVPIDLLHDNPDNPNVEDERTFDILVEKIRTHGFDEPVIVVPRAAGGYEIVSGHHRCKAARVLGYKQVPCVIKTGWDETTKDIEVISRNNVRGKVNPDKFSAYWRKLAKRNVDPEVTRRLMGFTTKDAFDKIYKAAEDSITDPVKKKKLADAKETIRSVDDLSSVLNTIFKENGSELDHGFLVFSFGGKNHHYVQIDKELDKLLTDYRDGLTNSEEACEFFKQALKQRTGVKTKG